MVSIKQTDEKKNVLDFYNTVYKCTLLIERFLNCTYFLKKQIPVIETSRLIELYLLDIKKQKNKILELYLEDHWDNIN